MTAALHDASQLPERCDADPSVVYESDVLDVATSITDRALETRDDTTYTVQITNRSRYYIAEDIRVAVDFAPGTEIKRLDDGNVSLAIVPREQRIRCLGPRASKDLLFKVITRGAKPGAYLIKISTAYKLVYFEKRDAGGTTEDLLPVHDGAATSTLPLTPVRMPRKPTYPRSNAMSDQRQSNVQFPTTITKGRRRVLQPVVRVIPLPGGGDLEVSYRLVKGTGDEPDTWPCSYGFNPESNELESYFTSEDTATLEMTLHNASHHHLKHVHLTNIRFTKTNHDGSPGAPATDKAQDGNLLIEIIPADVYFGHLHPGHRIVKHLSVITRNVKPANYLVQLDAHYDVEQCRVPVDLGLTVLPD
jgi:hypothetical protein